MGFDAIKEINEAVPDSGLDQINTQASLTQNFQQVAINPNQAIDIQATQDYNAGAQAAAEQSIEQIDASLAVIEEFEARIVEPDTNPLAGPSISETVQSNFQQVVSNIAQAGAAAFTGGGSLATMGAGKVFSYAKDTIKEGAQSRDMGSEYGYGANTGWSAQTKEYGDFKQGAAPVTVGSGPIGNKSDVSAARGAIARSGGSVDMGNLEITEAHLDGIQKIKMDLEDCRAVSENCLTHSTKIAATLKNHENIGTPRLDEDLENKPENNPEEEYEQQLANYNTGVNLSGGMAV